MLRKILVAGGAGFIGSHLCGFLLNKNFEVVCLDNLLTGNTDNIEHLLKEKNFEFVKADIVKELTGSVGGDFEMIFNLASPASPVHYQLHPIETLEANSIGTKNLLELAKQNNSAFLQASTSEVYGDPLEHPQKESYWGNVNPNGIRSCFSEDTELLTKKGWILFKELSPTCEIMTLNEKGLIEYQKALEIIREQYNGELIKFKNSKIDLIVTPNHKMYVKQRDKKRFSLIEAFESIRWERSELLKAGLWIGEEREFFYLPLVKNSKIKQKEKIKMDTWLEFFGYFITEGCTYKNIKKKYNKIKEYKNETYTVLISQSNKVPEKRNKIKECLKRLDFKFYEEKSQFRILSKQLYTELEIFGKSKDRYIPNEFLALSSRQLKILFDAMMLGDGSSSGKVFYSSSKRLLDNMQEILLKIGLAGTISTKDRLRNTKMVFILSNKFKDFLTPLYPKRTIEKYNGFVYCVIVPNHVIYVRRNGKALWCGNCYDEGKRFSEAIIMAYHRKFDLNSKIVRIFNTYGPRMQAGDGRVVPNFILQALKNEPITVYGNGKQTRSFCFVSDLVEGFWLAINSNEHEPINLGNPAEFNMIELAEKIIELAGSKSEIVFRELPKDDPTRRKPDISKAKRILNWEPKIGVEDGLKQTIDYFKTIYGKKQ